MSRTIVSKEKKLDLLARMLHLSGRSPLKAARHLEYMLIDMPTSWTLIDDTPLQQEYVDLWANRYGEWMHSGGNTKPHNDLGMAFAWWALHEAEKF
jgi:hypothetical protein